MSAYVSADTFVGTSLACTPKLLLHRMPGQTQHATPPLLEQVPERFCEDDHCPLLHRAVAPAGGVGDAGQASDGGGGGGTTAPAWLTETVLPATDTLPLRAVEPLLAAVNVAVPLPTRPAPIESQLAFVDVDQAQFTAVDTLTVVMPPPDPGE